MRYRAITLTVSATLCSLARNGVAQLDISYPLWVFKPLIEAQICLDFAFRRKRVEISGGSFFLPNSPDYQY